jgi:hypothetical protein
MPEAPPTGRRLSLDFRGPPLALPGEEVRRGEGASAPVLHEGEGFLEGAHDAWTHDRARRASTPPPDRVEGASRRPVSYSDFPPPVATPVPEVCEADVGGGGPDAIGLVDRSQASMPPNDLASEMRERYALDDFTGALRAAELLLGQVPGHPEAQRYAASSRERLEQLYSTRLGGLGAVPTVTVGAPEVRWLGIDHRAGFLLSRIDGCACVEDILDMSGMPRLEALQLLSELQQAGAIRSAVG